MGTAERDAPTPSPAEQLADQFYSWELRGRGWQVWDRPVEPEPPFIPFFGYSLSSAAAADDGRKHTLLSGAIQWLNRAVHFFPRSAPLASPDPSEERDPDECQPAGELVELELALPHELTVSPDAAEQFLLSLSPCRALPAFEFVGLSDALRIQLACSTADAAHVRRQVEAYFPDVVVNPTRHQLRQQWEGVHGNPVIADLGLSREFMLPLGTSRNFTVDPLTAVAGALADVSSGEIALLQVLFRPVRHPWAESVLRSVTFADGTPLFDGVRDFVKQAKSKLARPLFAAVVRIGCRATEDGRAWEMARRLVSALSSTQNPEGNELIPLENEDYDDEDHEEDLLMRRSRRSGMLLSSEELVSFVHLPSASIRLPKLRGLIRKTKAAPAIVAGHRYGLGESVHGGTTRRVTLSAEQRSRHVHVVGASGTGKSTFLLNLIVQDISQGDGVAVLDPHGDLVDAVLERIPKERLDDVIVFDPADEEFPVGFNILSAKSELEKTLLSSDLVAVFRRLSTSWGDQMNAVLANAVMAFVESPRGGSLLDLRRFLVEPPFRKEFLGTVKDPEVVYYWEKEFPLLVGRPHGPVLTRLNQFLRPRPIRHIVAQRVNRLDFTDIMDRGRIFLARLSHGAVGEENAWLLGSLLVSKVHQMALGRQRVSEKDRRYFWLYLDEFQHFATPSMAEILSGARKYRLGLVLAHQELRQLESRAPEIASAVIATAYTRVCFRLGDNDAKKLESGFSTFAASDLQSLGTGEAICRVERSDYDFNLRTPPVEEVESSGEERRKAIIEQSRKKYAVPKATLEQELAQAATSAEPETLVEQKPRVKERKVEVVAEEPAPVVPIVPASPPAAPLKRPKPPPEEVPLGRGGPEHKYLQQLIKQWAEGMGFRATIEEKVLGCKGVDVGLRKGATSIACEICITTEDLHELGNVRKGLAAGYQHVAVLSPDARRLAKLRSVIEPDLTASERDRVHFFVPDELFAFVQDLEVRSLDKEATVRGYKVKTSYRPVDPHESGNRRQVVSEVVAKSVKRLEIKKTGP
jgi:hypothetical protein